MNKKVGISEYFDFVEKVTPFLDAALISKARDVEYGEWEVPFEALLLALIKLPRDKVNIDLKFIEDLAYEADIVESSVLDVDSWEQFKNWYEL